MTTYTVEWTIEIKAKSPEEAARKAAAIQDAGNNSANRFDVYSDDPDEGDGYCHHMIDLEAIDAPSMSEVAL